MAFHFIRYVRNRIRSRHQDSHSEGVSLAFSPLTKRYRLKQASGRYTYIPPELPVHFNKVLARLDRRPKFSIVVALYNTSPALLKKMLHSVLEQWYPDWRLILVNDASSNPATLSMLKKIDHPQVMVLNMPHHAGISGAINAGIDMVSGEYLVFLDHEDELTEDCLFELALCINREEPDFIYSDEDPMEQTLMRLVHE